MKICGRREKAAASGAVCRAVRKGKIKRSVYCESCGLPAETQGHHADYSKPLEVDWFCRKCHLEEHKRLNRLIIGWTPPDSWAYRNRPYWVENWKSTNILEAVIIWQFLSHLLNRASHNHADLHAIDNSRKFLSKNNSPITCVRRLNHKRFYRTRCADFLACVR